MRSCETCMQINDEQTRQLFGCGWASLPPARLRPFVQVPAPLKYEPLRDADGNELPRDCPTYAIRLPIVQEIATARFWKHDLRTWCDGKPTPELMLGVQVLETAICDVSDAKMTPQDRGGLG